MEKNDELLEWQSKLEETLPKATNKRVLIKKSGRIPDNAKKGKVIAATGILFLVKNIESEITRFYECVKAGAIISQNENSTLVSVGDAVWILPEKDDCKERIGKGTIIRIDERHSFLSRMNLRTTSERLIASNVEYLLIMASLRMPKYNKRLIDRLLIAAELGELTPIICINKIDLGDDKKVDMDMQIYKEMGIEVFLTSFIEDYRADSLKEYIKDKSSVLVGSSGVGKSTFINNILGTDVQKISDVSSKTSKGKHTTSFVRLFELPEGGEIIDSPGIREFGLYGIQAEELTLYFHDFDNYYEHCRFMPCTHTHEPKCAVKQAVENSEINFERYESYLNIFDSLRE